MFGDEAQKLGWGTPVKRQEEVEQFWRVAKLGDSSSAPKVHARCLGLCFQELEQRSGSDKVPDGVVGKNRDVASGHDLLASMTSHEVILANSAPNAERRV
ncbi:MAG: hypothetical protein CNCCGFBP_01247 [Fimbriimonadaceae bacterium]|nr:hypothetical protein [Fimbriimonadaceae bacterium]